MSHFEPPPPYPGSLDGRDILLQRSISDIRVQVSREREEDVHRRQSEDTRVNLPELPPYDELRPGPSRPPRSSQQRHRRSGSVEVDPRCETTAQALSGRSPVLLKCPECASTVQTSVYFKSSNLQWFLCILICLFGGFMGCCLIPFCCDVLGDIEHSCPNCHSRIYVQRISEAERDSED